MKKLLTILLFATLIQAAQITKTVGSFNSEQYLVLTLEDLKPFSCKEYEPAMDQSGYMECDFVDIPVIKPEAIEDSFFEVIPIVGSERFKVKIIFKKQAKIYAVDSSTRTKDPITPMDKTRKSRRWIVVGYDSSMPVLNQSESATGLSFPIDYFSFENPTVGALDSAGNIVVRRDSRDSMIYEQILSYYNQKNYTQALRTIDENMNDIKTLFLPEILSIKIKSLDQLGGNQKEVVNLASGWIRAYTLHNDMPEIMFILAKAQMWLGLSSEAVSNYNTIIREYPNSRFADLAKVYRADRILIEGRLEEASIWFNKVYFETKDIEAASLAAARLAEIAIKKDEFEKAAKLYDKVIEASSEFFEQDLAKSEELLYIMVDNKIYSSAAKLGELLIKHKEPKSDAEEDLLLSLARWQTFAGMQEKAIESYSRFIRDFPYSKSLYLAKKERDILLLDSEYGSDEERIEVFDRIVANYPEDESASRALYAKTKIFLKQGRYSEVKQLLLQLDSMDRELFQDYDQLIRQIERTLLNSFVLQNACKEAVDLINERKLGTTLRSDEPLYSCAFKERAYPLALEISRINQRKSSKINASNWIEKELDTLLAMGDYPLFADKLEEFMRMQRAFRIPIASQRYIELFDTYYRLGERDDRLEEIVKNMEHQYPKEPKIMDMYFSLSHLASRKSDPQMLYLYSKKLLNEHRKRSVRSFSPDNELFFVEAAKSLGKTDEAILVLQTMDLSSINEESRARVLFTLGDLLNSNNPDLAKNAFIECKDLGDNPWSKLCEAKVAL